MAQSNFFSHGTKNEQYFHEDLIVESLHIYGQNFFYIPRTLIGKDEILGEDRLSKFKSAYQIEMYLENVDGFEGQGAFIQKFGLMMEQSATLVVARRRWQQLIGRFGETIIPTRPCEGDLIYFPLTDGLFEIKFVQHQDPFYQIGKLFVYKLQIELFQYASERIETGVSDIDAFETLKSFDITKLANGVVTAVDVTASGSGYNATPTVVFGRTWTPSTAYEAGEEVCYGALRYEVIEPGTSGTTAPVHTTGDVTNGSATLRYAGTRATGTALRGLAGSTQETQVMGVNITNPGSGYAYPPTIFFVGSAAFSATATATISNLDTPESYGDNTKFKNEAAEVVFNESNPFGDIR